MTSRLSLDRTIRLIRDDISESASDEQILHTLRGTHVVIAADKENLRTHSAQTALATLALLMARSGHRVYLDCADTDLTGLHPPFGKGPLIASLVRVEVLPGIRISAKPPRDKVDLAIRLGDSRTSLRASRTISINADDWSGSISSVVPAAPWAGGEWPIGAMVAATLGAVEAFKLAVLKLRTFARSEQLMSELYAPIKNTRFEVAPSTTPTKSNLGCFDCVSGGAIIQSALFALAHLPNVTGECRVIEPDFADLSNLNRYMLLLPSRVGTQKAHELARVLRSSGLSIQPIPKRYPLTEDFHLSSQVLVGVDDIPTRWMVQRARPNWLGVGATTHWSAMASHHTWNSGGCAECLHPLDDPNDQPIPTVAFVSFFAGLLLAGKFLQHLVGVESASVQQIYTTLLRAENPIRSPVAKRDNCPTCSAHGGYATASVG